MQRLDLSFEPPLYENQFQFTTVEDSIPAKLDFSNLQITTSPNSDQTFDVALNSQVSAEQIQDESSQVLPHWFYSSKINNVDIWWPFNIHDSDLIESKSKCSWLCEEIYVKKGLFRASISLKTMNPVFWHSNELSKIRRATWYYQPDNDPRLLPFSETTSYSLDAYYNDSVLKSNWNVQFQLPSDSIPNQFDTFIFYSPDCLQCYQVCQDQSGNITQTRCILSRGLPSHIRDGLDKGSTEPLKEVLFYIQNPLDNLDMNIAHCSQLRNISNTLFDLKIIEQSFHESFEIIPFHYTTDETEGLIRDIRKRLQLCSIHLDDKMSNNDLLIESLLYHDKSLFEALNTEFRQQINFVIDKFKKIFKSNFENINFSAIAIGFSSVVLSEVLKSEVLVIKQNPTPSDQTLAITKGVKNFDISLSMNDFQIISPDEVEKDDVTQMNYPFKFKNIYFVGSQVSKYLQLENVVCELNDFLKNSQMVYNIFNPYDERSARIEPYFDRSWKKDAIKVPHYKNSLEVMDLKSNLTRVGSDLGNKVFQSLESTWKSFQDFAYSHISDQNNSNLQQDQRPNDSSHSNQGIINKSLESQEADYSAAIYDATYPLCNKRLDYSLQTAPLDSITQIVFGGAKHDAYLSSYDLMLFLLRTIKGCDSVSGILKNLTLN